MPGDPSAVNLYGHRQHDLFMSAWDCRKLKIHGAPFQQTVTQPPTAISQKCFRMWKRIKLSGRWKPPKCFGVMWYWSLIILMCCVWVSELNINVPSALQYLNKTFIYPSTSLHLLFAIGYISPPSPTFTNYKASNQNKQENPFCIIYHSQTCACTLMHTHTEQILF